MTRCRIPYPASSPSACCLPRACQHKGSHRQADLRLSIVTSTPPVERESSSPYSSSNYWANAPLPFIPSSAGLPNPERDIYNGHFTPSALADYAAQGYTLAYQRRTLRDAPRYALHVPIKAASTNRKMKKKIIPPNWLE
jgi:hypothetical protein